MALSSILRIYRARLRSRSVVIQELLAVLGLAVGVALLFASQVTSASLNRSVAQLSKQLVGDMQLQLLARGPSGFPDTLLPRVRAIPGVKLALPVLEQQADVIGPHGRASVDLIGTGPQFAHVGGPLLHRFSAKQLSEQKALALPVPIAQRIGAESLTPIKVQAGSHVSETLLGATLHEGDIGSLVNSPVAVAPVAYAQQLTHMDGRITRIFVKVRNGRVREVRHALSALSSDRANVEPASFDSSLFAQAAGPANQGAALFSAISALVGFMFAFNALLITAQMRRDLISELRRHGATRAMTIQALLFDALMLGGLGGMLGLLLGSLLSVLVFHPNPGYLSYAFPVGSQRVITWQSIALSLGAGLLAAAIGVLAPLKGSLSRPLKTGASRRPSLALVRDARIVQIAGGLVCIAATSAILAFDPAAAVVGAVTLLLALLCLLPPLFDALIKGFESLQRPLLSAASRLAVIELRTPSTRTRSLAIAATGAVAVFGSVAIDGAHRNLQSGLDRVASDMSRGSDLWVSAAGSANTLTTTPFSATTRTADGPRERRSAAGSRSTQRHPPTPPAGEATSIEATLRSLPHTSSVSVYRGSFLDLRDRRTWVIAPAMGASSGGASTVQSPSPSSTASLLLGSQLLSGDPRRALSRLRAGGWAVISNAIATERHLGVGDRFTLPSPHPIVLRVAALSTNVGWPGGAIVLSASEYERAWGSSQVSAFEVDLKRGVPPAEGAAEVRAALGPRSGLAVMTAKQREAQWRASSREGLSRLSVIALLVLVAAVLATAGAMAAMIWQRKGQLAYLKRQGYRRSVLWKALVCESTVLLSAGCLIGAVFGIYGEVLLSDALGEVTGFPIVMSIAPLLALWSVAIVSCAAAAIVAAPGWLAARVAPSVSPG